MIVVHNKVSALKVIVEHYLNIETKASNTLIRVDGFTLERVEKFKIELSRLSFYEDD